MFEEIDIDKNGTIDYTEFVMATMSDKQMMTTEKLQQAFRLFDRDGNGSIEASEIRQVLGDSKMSPEQIDDIIQEVDKNGDGEIQFDEFVHMMKTLGTSGD